MKDTTMTQNDDSGAEKGSETTNANQIAEALLSLAGNEYVDRGGIDTQPEDYTTADLHNQLRYLETTVIQASKNSDPEAANGAAYSALFAATNILKWVSLRFDNTLEPALQAAARKG